LVGLAVAIGCKVASPIVITDQENMLSLMERNIKLNELEQQVTAEVLDWYARQQSITPRKI
jgi:tRNA1(Val) A37 N6-methylase TrmN6